MTEQVDIAIIGGGIVGASLAHALRGRGSVLLLEQESALGYHSTGRSAAEFSYRFHSDLAGRLTAQSAGFMFAPPDGFSEVPLLKRRGNLIIASAEKQATFDQLLAQELSTKPAENAAVVQPQSVDQALERVPFLDPNYVAAAFYDPDCWDIEVESLLQSYCKSARTHGVSFQRGAQLQSARRESTQWRVITTQGEWLADTVVDAAGAWADPVAQLFGAEPLGLQPLRRTGVIIKAPGYDVADMPEVNEVDEDFYFKPDAGHLMVSPADETPVDPHDAWPEEMDIAIAADYLDQCSTLQIERVEHSWAGLRTFAPDRAPVIGQSGKVPGLFWLAGVGGYGIQTSPCVGELAAALLCDEKLEGEMASLAKAVDPRRLEVK